MSAPCIYHDDQPSVTLCPGCDFGVCQQCMDDGAQGVCSTCSEERAVRRETSAVQREYEVAASMRRCNYCRVGEDEETTLDDEGYCDACRVLPRCTSHVDLIAVGHCKGCRQEYCRKCLGFTDVCQACASKQKARPKKPDGAASRPAASRAASSGSGSGPAGARKKKRPAGATAEGPKGKRPKGPPGKSAEPEDKKKPKKPSRGEKVLKEKLEAKTAGKLRMQVLVVGIVGAIVCIVMASGMWMRAQSPEEQAKRLQEQMVVVHRGVIHYYRKLGQMPRTADDIERALQDMKARDARGIRVYTGDQGAPPSSVLFVPEGETGFKIQATDHKGELLKSPGGVVLYLDQYYDSTPG